MKICTKCKLLKDLSEFCKNHSQCKSCEKLYRLSRIDVSKEYARKYYESNKDKIIQNSLDYYKKKNKKSRSNYSIEYCHELALQFETKMEFYDKYQAVYAFAYRRGWLDVITSHMEVLGNLHKRLIYRYIFNDNYCYVGLTCNANKRFYSHFNDQDDPVFKHIKLTQIYPLYEELTGYVDVTDAIYLEGYYLEESIKLGFKPLNKKKTGGLGSKKDSS